MTPIAETSLLEAFDEANPNQIAQERSGTSEDAFWPFAKAAHDDGKVVATDGDRKLVKPRRSPQECLCVLHEHEEAMDVYVVAAGSGDAAAARQGVLFGFIENSGAAPEEVKFDASYFKV